MNPLSLEFTNFRSYKHAFVDISNIDTAVIIGKNGDGKSSIIYAMIYVLWGEVPDIAVLSDLVRKGARDMNVKMNFTHDDGNVYRIERGIKIAGIKKKTSSGYLTLSMVLSDGKTRDISGNSIDETTDKISNLMGGLTYKTALYSNFNLQGETDKFMNARPGERRKLFEDILNLKPYELLEKAARAKAKEAKDILRSLDYDDAKERQLETEIKTVEITLQELKKRTGITQISIETLVKSIQQLEILIGNGTTDLEVKQQSLYSEITRLRSQLEVCKKQIDECNIFIDKKTNIMAQYELLQSCNNQFESAGQVKQKYVALLGEKNVLTAQVQMYMNEAKKRTQELNYADIKLANKQKEIQTKFSLSGDITAELPVLLGSLKLEQDKIQVEIKGIDGSREDKRKQIDSLQADITTLIAEIKAIDAQIVKIEKSGPICPVFNHECSLLQKDKVADEIAILKKERQQKVEIGTRTKEAKLAKEKEDKVFVEQIESLEKRDKDLVKKINEIEITGQHYESLLIEISNTKRDLLEIVNKNQTALIQAQGKLQLLEQNIANLNFDATYYNGLEKQVNTLRAERWDAQYQKLLVAEETIKGFNEKNTDFCERMNLLGNEIIQISSDMAQRHEEIQKIQPELDKQRNALILTKNELEHLGKETSVFSQQLGTLQATLDQLQVRKNTAIIYQQQLINHENLVKVYQLARAMILESSIPRFQEFCNDCLDFLGVNIRVKIETIEETEDAREKITKYNPVFKIIVIDGEGDERDYATWSGGEKHRINIALRQALAMTLLNRSGVKIGLVVIDEGDSKLDENGKDALVQMIEATGNGRFGYAAKVLFVTHAEDLKDRFATRILVSKGQNGSTIIVQ